MHGHGASYSTGFAYHEGRACFTRVSCTCPAFERAPSGCKHVAALMIDAARRMQREDVQARSRQRLAGAERAVGTIERELQKLLGGLRASGRGNEIEAAIERQHEAQERARREAQERAERAEQERHDRFVQQLLTQAQTARGAAQPGVQEEPVRLTPLVSLREGSAVMELRVGRRRLYLIRNIDEFARRMAARETVSYGRDLTLQHCEESFREEDLALLRHVLMLSQTAQRTGAGHLLLQGAQLDVTMRMLMGRAAETRSPGGQVIPVRIREGAVPLRVRMDPIGENVLLKVQGADCVRGMRGAYVFLPEQGEILCAMDAAYDRIAGLLEVSAAFPDGLKLSRAQLPAFCARVIAPAAADVEMLSGAEILTENTPMPVTVRFYADMESHEGLCGGAPCPTCRVVFDYGGRQAAPGSETPDIRRDADAEERAAAAAKQLFPEEVAPGVYAFAGNDEEQFALINDRLQALTAWGEVMIEQSLARMNATARRTMSFGLSAAKEELVLRGDLGGFSQEDLREAYAAYRQRRRFVRLKNGTFLSGEALEQAAQTGEMLENLEVTAEEVERGTPVSASRAMYIEEALGEREEMTLTAEDEIHDWMDRLRQAQQADVLPPEGLNAQLRSYQQTGLSWLCALADAGFGGILADDMGLGKTIQALAMLLREKERGERVRALVVCPASLQLNWLSEAERFTPGLRVQAMMGGAAQRRMLIESLKGEDAPEVLIASYDQVRRDAPLYADVELSCVLLDEAQYIKNAASQGARAVKTLKARRRFAMTGTPVENRLAELWSIFDFLMPGYLYSYKRFKERFEAPIVHDNDENAQKSLRMMTAPFILRRMKKDVLDDLPDKTETLMTSEMTPAQRRLYAAYTARLVDEADGGLADAGSRMRILAGLTRLRQICCDPRLCVEDYNGGSGKLAQCAELVRDLHEGGHRALVFSQFTSMLALLCDALEAQGLSVMELTGETEKRERMELARRFNSGEGDVFLISLKAGGTGLNLTGADVVIHYDPWWNTAAQNQATDRAYRIGQTRGVQVFSLIAANTVEERILRLQQQKTALSDGVLGGGENLFTVDADMVRRILSE